MGKYIRGNVEENLAIGVVGSGALISDQWDETVNEKALLSSIVTTWSVDNLQPLDGPLIFGVAHSDYTVAEITEVIATGGSWDSGNLISQEISKRKVRQVGVISGINVAIVDYVHNEGRPVKTKLNWMLQTGDGLQMWMFNRGAAVTVTGATLKCSGFANLWQR